MTRNSRGCRRWALRASSRSWTSGSAIGTGSRSGGCGRLRLPETWIVRHEPRSVDVEQPHEGAAARLIPVGPLSLAPIDLRQEVEREGGKRDPGCLYGRVLADRERKAPNRKKIRRRAESQVDIDASVDGGARCAVRTPPALRINRHPQVNLPVADDAAHAGCPRRPGVVTGHEVVEPAGTPVVGKYGGAGQLPAVADGLERCDLVSRKIEPSPEDAVGHCLDRSSLESRMHRESREIREPGFLLDLPDLPVNSDGGLHCGHRRPRPTKAKDGPRPPRLEASTTGTASAAARDSWADTTSTANRTRPTATCRDGSARWAAPACSERRRAATGRRV